MNMAKSLINAFFNFPYPNRSTGPRRPYDGDELRAIRKRNGVGRPHRGKHRYDPHIDAWVRQAFQMRQMALGARCYGGKRGTEKLAYMAGA